VYRAQLQNIAQSVASFADGQAVRRVPGLPETFVGSEPDSTCEASMQGRLFAVEGVRHAKHDRVRFVRIHVPIAERPFGLAIGRLESARGLERVMTGDAAFDETFCTRATNAEVARAFLTPETRAELEHALQGHTALHAQRKAIRLLIDPPGERSNVFPAPDLRAYVTDAIRWTDRLDAAWRTIEGGKPDPAAWVAAQWNLVAAAKQATGRRRALAIALLAFGVIAAMSLALLLLANRAR
jgi:hypothetical protein